MSINNFTYLTTLELLEIWALDEKFPEFKGGIRMRKRTRFKNLVILFAGVFIFVLIPSACFADSIFCCPSGNPVTYNNASHELPDEMKIEEAHCRTTLLENVYWGPDKNKLTPKKETVSQKEKTKKYPAIGVRYRVYVKKPGKGGKYDRKLSSRSSSRVKWINVTPIIIREAKKNGISPLLLVGVIRTESGFNTYAVGPSGAQGLCQLMPATARNLGVKDPFNPEQNIIAGARYLGRLNRMFNGDVNRVLAAYNLGPGGVSGGIPGYAWTFINTVKRNMYW